MAHCECRRRRLFGQLWHSVERGGQRYHSISGVLGAVANAAGGSISSLGIAGDGIHVTGGSGAVLNFDVKNFGSGGVTLNYNASTGLIDAGLEQRQPNGAPKLPVLQSRPS
jgi:hypothetical protein